MPGGDGTGPIGNGPLTGGGRGPCAQNYIVKNSNVQNRSQQQKRFIVQEHTTFEPKPVRKNGTGNKLITQA